MSKSIDMMYCYVLCSKSVQTLSKALAIPFSLIEQYCRGLLAIVSSDRRFIKIITGRKQISLYVLGCCLSLPFQKKIRSAIIHSSPILGNHSIYIQLSIFDVGDNVLQDRHLYSIKSWSTTDAAYSDQYGDHMPHGCVSCIVAGQGGIVWCLLKTFSLMSLD